MKTEERFTIHLGDGREEKYEGTLEGAKRKASRLATPPVAIRLLAGERLVAARRPYWWTARSAGIRGKSCEDRSGGRETF